MTMIIRPGFAQGLEEELPSSLPQGFPYFSTDTRVIFMGRGESRVPIAIRSEEQASHGDRLQSVEDWIQATADRLDLRLGNIGTYHVDDALIEDGQLPIFNQNENKFEFIDPKSLFDENTLNDMYKQKTLFDKEGSAAEPYQVYLDIPYTSNFNRAPIEVLKLYPSQDHVNLIADTFLNDNQEDFLENSYIEFDGTMQPKISYLYDMEDNDITASYRDEISPLIQHSEFKVIEAVEVNSHQTSSATYSFVKDELNYYVLHKNEWIHLPISYPTRIDFVENGMNNISHLTTHTSIARFRGKKVDVESGNIHRFSFNPVAHFYQNVQSVDVIHKSEE